VRLSTDVAIDNMGLYSLVPIRSPTRVYLTKITIKVDMRLAGLSRGAFHLKTHSRSSEILGPASQHVLVPSPSVIGRRGVLRAEIEVGGKKPKVRFCPTITAWELQNLERYFSVGTTG